MLDEGSGYLFVSYSDFKIQTTIHLTRFSVLREHSRTLYKHIPELQVPSSKEIGNEVKRKRESGDD